MKVLRFHGSHDNGRAVVLEDGLTRVGRHPECDLTIDDETVSTDHCEIMSGAEGVFVRDLNSTNGTCIDGEPVVEGWLQPGQQLRVGAIDLVFELVEISIPVAHAAEPVAAPLPPGAKACANHPVVVATFQCGGCERTLCMACVHVMPRVTGGTLTLCPSCGQVCKSIAAPVERPKNRGALLPGWLGQVTRKLTGRFVRPGR